MAILRFHVVPNAKSDMVVGEHGGAIKVKLRAPALEGKANAALIRFLADLLKVPSRTIVVLRGHKSRDKVIRIEGLREEELRTRLATSD
jgi:uncharacterized protein (TIGR00251 family)